MTSASSTSTDEVNPRLTVDDVGDPSAVLRPIEGYQNSDKLSLEQATNSIAFHFKNLERDIWLSRKATETLKDYLNHDESAAIHLYTMELEPRSLYTILNELLRAKDRKKLKPWFPYLNLILTALFKVPSITTIVWRGVKAKLHHLYEKGKFYIWWSFTSCTLSVELLENPMYLGDSDDRTLFSIECFSGKSIKNYSYYHDEDEILLLPGTYLEVIGKAKIGEGLYIIRMREVKPPHVLLEPPTGFESTQNIEFILDSVYEVNKENDDVPKLFIILPDPLYTWNQTDFEKNNFLLHFVCECSINEIHLAHYPGYAIPYPRLFFKYYSRYIQQFMMPLGKHLFSCRRINNIHHDEFWNIFMKAISEIEKILTQLQSDANNLDVTMLDTRELPDFLSPFQRRSSVPYDYKYLSKCNIDKKIFSNLCRSITVDMAVRWVCTQHYATDQLEAMYRVGTLDYIFLDIITSNIYINYEFKNMDSIRKFKNIVPLHTRCYYLNFDIHINKSMIQLFDEIIDTVCRIRSLSFGNISFYVEGENEDEYLSDQLLWRFIESNVYTKNIIAPGRQTYGMEKLAEPAITTLTLRSLSVYGCDCPKTLQNKQFIQRLIPKLSSLSIQVPDFSTIVSNLCELIRSTKKLNQLYLAPISKNSKLDALNTGELQCLCEAICVNTTIKRLHICHKFADSDALFLANIIRSCSNLMSLTLEGTIFTPQGINYMMEESGKSNSLLFLYFGTLRHPYGSVSDSEILHQFPVTRCLTTKSIMVTYSVCNVRVSTIEISRLAENLKTNMILTHLCLQNVLISNQAECIVNALCFNSTLVSLNLSYTHIDHTEAEKIAELLESKVSNLRMLDLSNCWLTDQVARPFLIALGKNRRITHLNLDDNEMNNGSANIIAAIIAVNQSLTCLSMQNNRWTVSGFEHIAQSLIRNSTLTEFYFAPHYDTVQRERAVEAIYTALKENTTIIRTSDYYGAEEQRNVLLVKRPNMILA